MTFEDALQWCAEHDASWGFERHPSGTTFLLWLQVDLQRTVVVGEHATDWGWMLIEAVARMADESPTARILTSARSGTRPRVDANATTEAPPALRRVL